MHLKQTVLDTIRRHQMVPPGGRILVALSGGPDSVGLLHLLEDLQTDGHFVVAGVVHFNHQLRGGEADGDEAFCRQLAAGLGREIEVGRADVKAVAARERRSIEDAARTLRYAFFDEAAARLRADVIAVGHTRDDQAETFLLRLIRGSGTRGLGGIRPRVGRVVRPLLEVSRAEVRAYLEAGSLPYREDATNLDVRIPRNRVRHELLPYLAREFSPNIVEVLAREAVLAQQDDDRLQTEAIDFLSSVVLSDTHPQPSAGADHRIVIEAGRLDALHPALASRVVLHVLARVGSGRFVGADAVTRLLRFVRTGGPRLSLPGCEAVREGDSVRIQARAGRGSEPANSFRIPLSIPGEVVLDAQSLAVSAAWAVSAQAADQPGTLRSGYVTVSSEPLAIRSRQPGDRFQPPGLGGRSKKLQDYFVDRKVARESRDFVPLVVDANDQIIWVVGHGFSEAFRAAGPSAGVILLKARRLGGEG